MDPLPLATRTVHYLYEASAIQSSSGSLPKGDSAEGPRRAQGSPRKENGQLVIKGRMFSEEAPRSESIPSVSMPLEATGVSVP